jgi:ATP-binding cassette subfamily F protein 3
MTVLHITDLKKTLGSREILRGGDLRVDNGEKVGIVGRNGEGKTTLLRLIEGEEPLDEGTIHVARGARMGYVVQRPAFDSGLTVRSYVEKGLKEVHALEKELEAVSLRMGEVGGDELTGAMKHHGELTARMDFLGGWETERRVETVLSGIGLAESLWDREARTLSGGEKSRTAMARELVATPDLLLLDEPTNHLDLAGIEWLEGWLAEMKSAVLLVSHDRRLLDRVVDVIVEVERGLLQRYPGNYSRYVKLKEERFNDAYRQWEQQHEFIRKEEAFIKKHMGSQRTGEAKGKRKRLSNVKRLDRPYNDVHKPTIRMAKVERGGEQVLEADGRELGYDDNILMRDASFRLGRGERVGIIGPNGSGKTTLLKTISGILPPRKGEIRLGYRAVSAYYDQETSNLDDGATPYEEIRREHPLMADLEIRSHLARFLFRGKDIDLSIKNLSGGERSRLSIAKLVLTGPSWLALDEPTNHLDLAGRTALEEWLSEFPGALVVITHDRTFLDDLVHRIVEVKDGQVRAFRGNYTEYKRTLAEEAEHEDREKATAEAREKERRRAAEERASKQKSERGSGGKRARAKKESGGARKRNPWTLKKLEEAIIELEKERETLLAAMGSEEAYKKPDGLRETQFRLAEVERDLEDKNREWELYG